MKRLARAAERLQRRAGGPIEVAIVLGSGLAEAVRGRIDGREIAYEKLHAPQPSVAGHAGVAMTGMLAGKRVVAFAGRPHLYEGYDTAEVTYLVRLAAAASATTLVLTNAAGSLTRAYEAGDVMLIADHINLTGASVASNGPGDPFLDMTDAYSARLRALARDGGHAFPVHEGVYAGVRGPQYETPAESAALRALGADAVGMSTVLETIVARQLKLEVLGISLIANASGAPASISHDAVLDASRSGDARIAELIESVLAAL